MTDPKRWLDAERSLLGALTRSGAAERPSTSAKQRARAAVLLATAGGAASAAVTKAAAASTAASTSAPPISLAGSGTVGGAVATGSAASSAAATGTAAGTAGSVVATGAAGLTAKFGASAVVLGVAAKWTGVSAVVTAVGFGGYQLASSGGVSARLTDPQSRPTPSVAVEARQLPTQPQGVTSREVRAREADPALLRPATPPAGAEPSPHDRPVGSQETASSFVPPLERRVAAVGEPISTAKLNDDAGEHAVPSRRSSSREPHLLREKAALPTSLAHNQELALVDRAWAALRTGRPGEALRLIEGYAWTASERQFETEALLIRLEALTQSGRHEAARALANKILTTHDSGRLADRARQTLSERTPTSP